MSEIDFKYNLMKYKYIYNNLDMFNYIIELLEYGIEILVTFNNNEGKILPFIQVRSNKKYTLNYYQSFKKALRKIEKLVEEGK